MIKSNFRQNNLFFSTPFWRLKIARLKMLILTVCENLIGRLSLILQRLIAGTQTDEHQTEKKPQKCGHPPDGGRDQTGR